MRVSFDGGRLNERGVAVALYDYAHHARRRLGVEPVVLHDASGTVEADPIARFAAALPLRAYRSEQERAHCIEDERIDVAYALKTTRPRYPIAPRGRTVVHDVFRFFDPHGDAYAYISPWLAQAAAAGLYPAVPHIVDPPAPQGDLRAEFGVPREALVVGRHGGPDQLNVPFVPAALEAALAARPDLWVMLLNTAPLLRHERVIHVPRLASRERVADFVASCDVGLNARLGGEAFGLAIAEYLAQDKPVLVWEGGRDRHHLKLVDDPRFRFRTREELTRALAEFEPRPGQGRWRARVAAFSPEAVMEAFARVFLAEGTRPRPRLPLGFRLGAKLKARAQKERDGRWIRAQPNFKQPGGSSVG
jgi:glycosyltransferase involved in cell wall biosynthesis